MHILCLFIRYLVRQFVIQLIFESEDEKLPSRQQLLFTFLLMDLFDLILIWFQFVPSPRSHSHRIHELIVWDHTSCSWTDFLSATKLLTPGHRLVPPIASVWGLPLIDSLLFRFTIRAFLWNVSVLFGGC